MDSGTTFSNTVNLSNNPGVSANPQIDASGSNVSVIWNDRTLGLNDDILLRSSTDDGTTFSSTANLSNNLGVSVNPQIESSGSNIYVVWEDDTDSPGIADVFFRAIVASSSSNNLPIANAGPDQTVNEDTLVTLDGPASSDPDGDTLTYSWIQIAGPALTLSNANTANPTFNAPLVDADTALTFQLIVNDGLVDSLADKVNIVVLPIQVPPTQNAGQDLTFTLT